jgi:hypothetical protein
MNDYSFFPSITAWYPALTSGSADNEVRTYPYAGDPGDTVGRLFITGVTDTDIYVYWRYITASGPPEIWIGLGKDGKIVAVCEAEDPPPEAPPIYSENIETYIQIKPDPSEFYRLREQSEGLLSTAIKDLGVIQEGVLQIGRFSFKESQRLAKNEVKQIRQSRITEALMRRDRVWTKLSVANRSTK